jgi:hypothetical protein
MASKRDLGDLENHLASHLKPVREGEKRWVKAMSLIGNAIDTAVKVELQDLATKAREVMQDFEKHGGAIWPHLSDTDDNAGQRLRDAIDKVLGPVDQETKLAVDLKEEIGALAEKYKKHEHLAGFASSLEEVAEEIDACLEDVEGVE